MAALFARERFDRVVHLAAQAGVRYSLQNPHAYVDSNLVGFLNILEGCRHNRRGAPRLRVQLAACTAATRSMPFSEHDNVDHPVSLYAATKKANELMAHSYSHLYSLPTTGLRFFTVYGPWGRPDMALFLFTKAILEGRPIDVFNHGRMQRDFTYIDDIVEGVVRVLDRLGHAGRRLSRRRARPGDEQCAVPRVQHRQPHAGAVARVHRLHRTRARQVGEQAAAAHAGRRRAGDLRRRGALHDWVGFVPATPIEVGIGRFVAWYRDYYGRSWRNLTADASQFLERGRRRRPGPAAHPST